MKKELMLVLGVILLVGLAGVGSAFSVDSYRFTSDFNCADFGVECGIGIIVNPNDIHNFTEKSCGVCSSDKYCYNGKCINPFILGTCERNPGFNDDCAVARNLLNPLMSPKEDREQIKEDNRQTCIFEGCDYDSQTNKCTGTIGSCSFLMNKFCLDISRHLNGIGTFNTETGFCSYHHEYYDSAKYVRTEEECSELDGAFVFEDIIGDDIGSEDGRTVGENDFGVCVDSSGGIGIEKREQCSDTGDAFYESGGICDYSEEKEKFLPCLDQSTLGEKGCRYSNLDLYEPKIYIYYKGVPSNLIYFSTDDLEYIKSGNTISIPLKLVNSGLPAVTPVKFNIIDTGNYVYDEDGELIYEAGALVSLEGIVDENGEVNVEWLFSSEELSQIDFEGGRDVGYNIQLFVEDIPVISVDVYRDPLISIKDVATSLKFKTTTGECLGEVSLCEDYDNWYLCHEAEYLGYGCTWTGDYASGSCVGGEAIPCDYSRSIKDICIALGCTWRADSFWERFADWIKGIFGG